MKIIQYIKTITFLFTLLSVSNSFAQKVVEVSDKFAYKQLQKQEILFFEDKNGSLSFEDISNPKYQKEFKVIPKESPGFGYSSSTFWFKIKAVKHSKAITPDLLLEVEHTNLDSLVFFYQNKKGQWTQELSGDMLPFSQRKLKFRTFVFELGLHAKEAQTFYLKVHTRGTVIVPMVVQTKYNASIKHIKQEIFFGFFYGILFIMGVYNLFLFFSLRDRSYLLYFLTIILNILAQGSLSGHTTQLLWGDSVVWANYSLLFFICASLIVMLLFSIDFLDVKKYSKKAYYLILTVLGFNIIFLILLVTLDYSIIARFTATLSLITTVTLLASGYWIWILGNKYARFFSLAWTIYLIGAISYVLRDAGILPDIFLFQHGIRLGSIIEVSLLSFALADKINIYRKKTEEAQQFALDKSQENEKLIKEQNEVLERKVEERTYEIQQKQEEILTQNEELLQAQEELQTQRDYLEHQHRQISSSIKAAQNIQDAILPYQAKLDRLLKEYFIINRPKDVVSGDFYWIGEANNTTILIAADCTGHGVPGAFMTLIGTNLLDKIIRMRLITSPANILNTLHEEINIVLMQKQKGISNGMDAVVIALQKQGTNTQLTFAGAKNSLQYYNNETQELLELRGTRKSIGGVQNESIVFENQTITLTQGSIVYLGSDGLADQNNKKRKSFTKKRLTNLLEQVVHLPLPEQQTQIERTLDDFMVGTTQRDDILWMGVKV